MTKESLRINEMQVIQASWQEIILGEQSTPHALPRKLQEEDTELIALRGECPDDTVFNATCREDRSFRKAVAMEATDIVIVGIGLIHTLGLNVETLFLEKMQTNHEKYTPARIKELLLQGYTREEALTQVKSEWNSKKNNHR